MTHLPQTATLSLPVPTPCPNQAAIDLSEKLLSADQPLWEDGVLTADELTDVMARVVVALKSAPVDSQQRAIGGPYLLWRTMTMAYCGSL